MSQNSSNSSSVPVLRIQNTGGIEMARNRKKFSLALVALVIASPVVAVSAASASVSKQAGKTYSVTATFKNASNLTVVVMGASGRQLASANITKASQKVTLKTIRTNTLNGATLQLVNSASASGDARGDYFGPVVLSWNGAVKSSKATKLLTKIKTKSTKLNFGTITVKKVSATSKQGWGIAKAKVKAVSAEFSRGINGRPIGVGNYGATGSSSIVKTAGVHAFAPGDPNSPEKSIGGDLDKDGIPNAFDVNDDGDDVIDSGDTNSPQPFAATDNGNSTCAPVNFRIFTNFKATQGGFAGSINAYGVGSFLATDASIAAQITKTMSMVFSPITQVCGQAVTKTELKGVGVPYAPSEYIELGSTCFTRDYQWLIGTGRMCGQDATGYSFGSPYSFTSTDLPSGQDTFSMRVTLQDGSQHEFTSSPGFVFVTHPLILSYSTDGTTYTDIDYSNTRPSNEGPAVNAPKISVSRSQDLYLKIYRPQRLGIEGEGTGFFDLGGYRYTPDIPNGIITNPTPGVPATPTQGPGNCDAQAFTDTAMSSDVAINTTSKPTLNIKWNIGKCFTDRGIAWSVGELTVDIQVVPQGLGGNSAQKLFLVTT